MEGTFRFGDGLIIEPVPLKDVRPGDIVVYRRSDHDGAEGDLVHRVISVRPEGLVTQGDNNYRPDNTLVNEGNLKGRVRYAERNGRRIPVSNGLTSLFRVRVRRGWNILGQHIWRLVRGMGRGTYSRIRESGLIPLQSAIIAEPDRPSGRAGSSERFRST